MINSSKPLEKKPIKLALKRGKYKFTLLEDYTTTLNIFGFEVSTKFISLSKEGVLTLSYGYSWDGASGAPDTVDFAVPSLIHDALYQLHRLGEIPEAQRNLSDKAFYQFLLKEGTNKAYALIIYLIVRLIGWKFTTSTKEVA